MKTFGRSGIREVVAMISEEWVRETKLSEWVRVGHTYIPFNSLPKGTFCRGCRNNQAEKVVQSGQVSFSPQLPLLLSYVARTRIEVMYQFNSTDLCWLLPSPNTSPSKSGDGNQAHNMASFPSEPARHLVAVRLYWAPFNEGSAICPHWNRLALALDSSSLSPTLLLDCHPWTYWLPLLLS